MLQEGEDAELGSDRKEEDRTETEACIKAEMEESDTASKGVKKKIKNETDIKILKQSDEQETEPDKEMVTKEDKQDTDKSTKDLHQTEITVQNEKVSENQTRSSAKGAKNLEDQKEGEEKSAAATKRGGEKIGSKCSDVSKSIKVVEGRKKGKERDDKSCIEGFDGPKRSDANSTVSKSSEVVGEGRKKAKEKYGKGGQVESAKHVSIRFDLTTVM